MTVLHAANARGILCLPCLRLAAFETMPRRSTLLPQCRRIRLSLPPPCRAESRPSDTPPDVVSSGRRRRQDSEADTSASPAKPKASTLKEEARQSNQEVFDRLIDAFLARPPEDWRKLIAYSKQWPSLSEGVLSRMEERAAEVDDANREREIRRAARRLRSVSDELADYRSVLEKFRQAPSRDWESLITRHRTSMNAEFFSYLELRIRAATSVAAATGAGESQEAEALAALATQLAALVEAHDRVAADQEALSSAAEKFAGLLQAESMEEAEMKIDELAASGSLDPALLLTMAKAYAGVKETDVTQEQVKDIMAHLYFKAKESFARQAPPEARIIKFLLSVDSPADRAALLEQALTPGLDLSTENDDYLHSTPPQLLNTVENVLGVYDGSLQTAGPSVAGMAGQAAALMNPDVILRLRELRELIRNKYM